MVYFFGIHARCTERDLHFVLRFAFGGMSVVCFIGLCLYNYAFAVCTREEVTHISGYGTWFMSADTVCVCVLFAVTWSMW